jgi:hypothetical protein
VDCDTALTVPLIASMKQAKDLDFVVRYLGSVTTLEITDILESGLGLQLVTFSRVPGWMPTVEMGTEDGRTDVLRLQALGIPSGMLVWIDLEGSSGDAADTMAWINARAQILVQTGYVAGLYVGSQSVLNAVQLYALPDISRYWRAFNQGIPEPQCGWCQTQLFPPNQQLGGVEVDWNYTQTDFKGRVPMMLIASELASPST